MNLKRDLFLHDLITDEEINICAHIFHILHKTAARIALRNCIPFCCLISKILKLKGFHPLEDESPYPKLSPINIRMLNASIGHSWKGIKTGSRSSSSSYDQKLDNIMAFAHDISTKMSGLATLLHLHNIHCDTKFTSLYTQLDQIQRVVQKPYPRSKLNRKTEQNQSRTKNLNLATWHARNIKETIKLT